ncbi:unnamed protein product [Chironomus riparius]|uniref:Deltamethrin resistance protein prag01 domain-containing protein n=1 Tax=Chironomus riparius TaxID=315576 RepID=A0A9N9RQA4_9DIPT|nr:unnamed protein product [Chironomus riparius]
MQGIRAFKLIARNANMIARRNYGKGGHKYPTMNEMPVPDGDFFAMHAKRNRKYNAILAGGIAIFSSAVYIVSTDTVIRLHWSPPDTYE